MIFDFVCRFNATSHLCARGELAHEKAERSRSTPRVFMCECKYANLHTAVLTCKTAHEEFCQNGCDAH